MQISLNHSQLEALIKAGLINVEKFSTCQVETREGDFTDSKGNKVLRTTIYVPSATNMVSGADIIKGITGKAAEAHAKDDLEKEVGA